MTPFELGINYWPRRRAMYMWRELDLGEVAEEFAHIADMGFDTVRLFALTQDFLPEREVVDTRMVARLVAVAGAAKDAGLRIVPTLIVINMSGRMWWPAWMHGSAVPADLYSDPALLRSQMLLVRTCASALAHDGSVRAFDIANEIDDAQRPPSRAAAAAWLSALAGAIRDVAPDTPVRIGAHLPSLTTQDHLRVDDIAARLDEDVMHAYPLYSEHARSFLDPELVPFACALTAGLSGTGRSVVMQEFGLCTAPAGEVGQTITDDFLGQSRRQYLASEEEGAVYYESVIRRLVETGAAGAYAWCYADYDPRLFTRPPLDTAIRERTFGLVRADGTEKPAARVFRELRKRRDVGMLARGDIPKVLLGSTGVLRRFAPQDDAGVLRRFAPQDDYYLAPGEHFARLYAQWVAARA